MCNFLLILMFRTYLGNYTFLQTFSFSVLTTNLYFGQSCTNYVVITTNSAREIILKKNDSYLSQNIFLNQVHYYFLIQIQKF